MFACAGVVLAQQGRTTPDDSSQQTSPSRGGQPSFAEEKSAGEIVPDRYIVLLKDNENARAVAEEHRSQRGAEVTHVYEHALRGYAAKIPSNRLSEVRDDPRVHSVSPDRVDVAFEQTMPTGMNRVEAELSSIMAPDGPGSVKSSNVGVAVLDTGINKSHPDLYVAGGRNFATWGSPNDKYEDGNGHGTHVAGTIGAKDNDVGAVGVAPETPLYGVKVLSNSGSGYRSWIIKGIDWVTANGPGTPKNIQVANMSLGGSGSDDGESGKTCSNTTDAYRKAICNSTAQGVTYVVAAGNSKADLQGYLPAAYNEVLTVSAVADFNGQPGGGAAATCRSDEDDTFANFSNYASLQSDQDHTIALPGVCIYSTWKSGGYNTISGTSMASPHGAGMAALYKITTPTATPADVMSKLREDASTWDNANGFTGDPDSSPTAGSYYGYLGHADGY